MSETETQVPRRLPLWKNWLDRNMDTVTYGSTFDTIELANDLGADVDSVQFAFSINEIRKALRRCGMNLTSRGTGGAQYVVVPPQTNMHEMVRMQRSAINSLREGVILGTSTPLDLLESDDRRRHEAVLEKMATRFALLSRKSLTTVNNKELQ